VAGMRIRTAVESQRAPRQYGWDETDSAILGLAAQQPGLARSPVHVGHALTDSYGDSYGNDMQYERQHDYGSRAAAFASTSSMSYRWGDGHLYRSVLKLVYVEISMLWHHHLSCSSSAHEEPR
jgi:hypothetical protein